MKIYVIDKNLHFKNKIFIFNFIKINHTLVNSIEEADVIYSPATIINIELYPTKIFIFGPHFSVFPNSIVRNINNKLNNGIYIQPSQPSVNTWQQEFSFNSLPMKAIPFGVDTNKFNCNSNVIKNNIIVYYKSRDPNELKQLELFLKNKQINYKIFSYQKKYAEATFLEYIQTCKYGIVLGCHESQGFAIEEMLSCNVPLLVWGVTHRKQEYPYISEYKTVTSIVSTVPYWDDTCGELFFNYDELEPYFNIFINKLKNNQYNPRTFILNNLSMSKCYEHWNNLLNGLINN